MVEWNNKLAESYNSVLREFVIYDVYGISDDAHNDD